MADQQQITHFVRAQVKKLLAQLEDDPQFTDDDSLVLSRRLSSLQVVELASRIEQQYHIDFAKQGFDQYVFDTVNSTVKYILAVS